MIKNDGEMRWREEGLRSVERNGIHVCQQAEGRNTHEAWKENGTKNYSLLFHCLLLLFFGKYIIYYHHHYYKKKKLLGAL